MSSRVTIRRTEDVGPYIYLLHNVRIRTLNLTNFEFIPVNILNIECLNPQVTIKIIRGAADIQITAT